MVDVIPPIVFTGEPSPAFCWPNWSAAANVTAYGGGFVSTLPVANVLDTRLELPARSINPDAANTRVRFNLGRTRRVRVLVAFTSASINATYRVTAGATDAALNGAGVYRSAFAPTWPRGLDPETAQSFRVPIIHVLPSAVDAPFWQLEVVDGANPAGFVDFSFVSIANLYAPANGMSVGASFGVTDPSDIVTTDGGTKIAFVRAKERYLTFAIDMQSESDVFLSVFEMQCDVGATQPFFFIYDTNDDMRLMVKRSLLCTQGDMSSLDSSGSMYFKNGYKLSEWR